MWDDGPRTPYDPALGMALVLGICSLFWALVVAEVCRWLAGATGG